MTREELRQLERGDIIVGVEGRAYVVDANYGDRVTAVRTVDVTNPGEWTVASRVRDGRGALALLKQQSRKRPRVPR